MKWRPVPYRTKQLCSFSFHCVELQGRGVVHRHPDAISAFLRFVPFILHRSSGGCCTRAPATNIGGRAGKREGEELRHYSRTRACTAMRVPLRDRLVTWLRHARIVLKPRHDEVVYT